jgi:hypothetical protein
MNCIKFCYHNYSLFVNSLFKKRWMRREGGGENKRKPSPIYTTQRGWWKWNIHLNWKHILAKWIIKLIFCN